MKQISKSTILSTEYKKWVDSFAENHDKYSSKNKHYFDVVMNLFHCQNGLCAYTEEILCNESSIEKSKWLNGKHIGLDDNEYIDGELEHFDSELKSKKGWLWDNLFMIRSKNNRKKGTKSIKNILKPDSIDYDENKYLSYNHKIDQFYPNDLLTDEEKKDVTYMIETLCINNVVRRKEIIKKLVVAHEYGMLEYEVQPKEYITAWNMTLKNLTK